MTTVAALAHLKACLSAINFLKEFECTCHCSSCHIKILNDCWRFKGIDLLVQVLGPAINDHSWLVDAIVRFYTFTKLDLKHTCCQNRVEWNSNNYEYKHHIQELDPDEILEIQEEDGDGIELLEDLLHEFKDKRQGQDLVQFLKGYWATRMEEVCRTRHRVDQQKLRELGITLVEDEGVDV